MSHIYRFIFLIHQIEVLEVVKYTIYIYTWELKDERGQLVGHILSTKNKPICWFHLVGFGFFNPFDDLLNSTLDLMQLKVKNIWGGASLICVKGFTKNCECDNGLISNESVVQRDGGLLLWKLKLEN